MASLSKQKGAQFEREVCRMLSEWLGAPKGEVWFWRSAMSGGRATLGIAKKELRSTQAGDISGLHGHACAFLNHFVVECKHVRSLTLERLVFNGSGLLDSFWKQVEDEAARQGKQPFLVMKQNGRPVLLGTTINGSNLLNVMMQPCVAFPRLSLDIYELNAFLERADMTRIWDLECAAGSRPKRPRLIIRK